MTVRKNWYLVLYHITTFYIPWNKEMWKKITQLLNYPSGIQIVLRGNLGFHKHVSFKMKYVSVIFIIYNCIFSLTQWVTRFFPRSKAARAWCSPLTSIKRQVNTEQKYTSSPVCVCMAWPETSLPLPLPLPSVVSLFIFLFIFLHNGRRLYCQCKSPVLFL